MVRNLIMILGLSLAVATFGCSDDPASDGGGGSAGDGGAGGSAGDGGAGGSEPVADACTNPADLAIVCDPAFSDDVDTCARAASGGGAATAACLVENTDVSADCASCYGDTTQCTLENCLASGCATEPDGAMCAACRAEFCDPAFEACTGDLATECASAG